MTQLLRTGKTSVNLNLDFRDIDAMVAMLGAALKGEAAPFQIEMSSSVLGRRWAGEFKAVQFRVVCSEADTLTWDAEASSLRLAIEADTVQMTMDRLTEAKTSRCIFPAEWCEVRTAHRSERDSLYLMIV